MANSGLLGVWTVWEPNALMAGMLCLPARRATTKAGGSCRSGIATEAESGLRPTSTTTNPMPTGILRQPARRAEVLIDPYRYRVAGKNLFITSTAAPILHAGEDALASWVLTCTWTGCSKPLTSRDSSSPSEAALGRGHVLLGEDGRVRYCSRATRRLICRYVGGRPVPDAAFPEPLHDLVVQEAAQRYFPERLKLRRGWTFASGSAQAGCSIRRATRTRAAFFCSWTNKSRTVRPCGAVGGPQPP